MLTCGDDTYDQLGRAAPKSPAAAPPPPPPHGSADPLGASPPASKGPKGPTELDVGFLFGGGGGGDDDKAPTPTRSGFPDTPRAAPTAASTAPGTPVAPTDAPDLPDAAADSACPNPCGTPRRAALPVPLLVRAVSQRAQSSSSRQRNSSGRATPPRREAALPLAPRRPSSSGAELPPLARPQCCPGPPPRPPYSKRRFPLRVPRHARWRAAPTTRSSSPPTRSTWPSEIGLLGLRAICLPIAHTWLGRLTAQTLWLPSSM